MQKFQIGQKVKSTYQGVIGVVISHESAFMEHSVIGVEYTKPMLGVDDGRTVTISRKFLERDFVADQS